MRNHETGLEYARFDHSDTRIRQAQYEHVPGWFGAFIWCLRHGDKESADLIQDLNTPKSDECRYGDCDDCHFAWCECPHHSAVQFRLQHPELKSLAHVASEEEEMEYV